MSDLPIPKSLDRRLRVMLRFVDFCIALIERIGFPDRAKPGAGPTYAKASKIARICAAAQISVTVAKLLAYLEKPRPLRALRAKLSKSAHRSDPAMTVQEQPGTDDHAVIEIATRIGRKARAMIRRDQLLRFGPRPVIAPIATEIATPEVNTPEIDTPAISAPAIISTHHRAQSPRRSNRAALMVSASPIIVSPPITIAARSPP